MTSRTHRRPRTPLQGLLLGLLLCAWLTAQTLGLVHRGVHAGALQALPQAQVASSAGSAAPHDHRTLFAGHAHAADCQLFDHALAADLLAGLVTLAVPAVWAAHAQALRRDGVQARVDVPFQARAPPFLR